MSVDPKTAGRMPSLPASAAILIGGMVLDAGGAIPFLTDDTINDEKFIRSCCVFIGMGTSVPGIVMGANWWHFKSLWAFLGLSDTSFHLLLHVSFAAAVVLIVHIGARIRNQLTGYLASIFLLVVLWNSCDFRMDMTYNHRIIPFLGALFLALSLAAVESGRIRYLAMAAFIAAITANIHLQASILLFSILGIALMMKGARGKALIAGISTFSLTAFATSPTAWIRDFQRLVAGLSVGGGGKDGVGKSLEILFGVPYLLTAGAVLAMLAIVAINLRDRDGRRWPLLLLAVIMPKFVVFGGAVALGVIGGSDKYLIDVEPAVGVALGLALVMLLEKVPFPFRRLKRSLSWASPYLFTAVLVVWPAPAGVGLGRDGYPMLQVEDIDALHDLLARKRGWNLAKMVQGLKGPSDLEILDYMSVVHPEPWEAPKPPGPSELTVLKLYADRSPDPVPSGWEEVRRQDDTVLWASWGDSWLDWGSFQVCTGPWDGPLGSLKCVQSGLGTRPWEIAQNSVVPAGFPKPARNLEMRLVIRFDVRYPAETSVRQIFMPDIPDRCSGRAVLVSGGESRVLDDGKMVLLKATRGGGTGRLELQWHVGGEGCEEWSYRAFVPFFAEGSPDSIKAMKEIIRAHRPLSVGANH
ncbi:MAG: hypothetical protein GXP54_12570 [Deltaproteobacteria bacterium]|nr:hypothetical protein [Deltaproteobacteria bacterium]